MQIMEQFLKTSISSFDNLGYDIPTLYSKYASWIKWDELEEQT